MEIKKIERLGHSASLSKDELWDIYKSMKTQRILEDRLLKMYKGGQLSGAVYPGIGQEASMAGIGTGMKRSQDNRSHARGRCSSPVMRAIRWYR